MKCRDQYAGMGVNFICSFLLNKIMLLKLYLYHFTCIVVDGGHGNMVSIIF